MTFARRLRHRRPRPVEKWCLDEVFIRIRGGQHYLWRAVDQGGGVLDILVQDRRDRNAAKRFLRRLLKGLQYVPRVIVTDKLRSYGVAQRHLLPGVEHRQSRYRNNRAENLHRPIRRPERQMQRFKSSEQGQDFLSAHSFIYGHFHPRRHRLAANAYPAIAPHASSEDRDEGNFYECDDAAIEPAWRATTRQRRRPLTATMTGVDRAHRREASLWLCQQWNRRK
jgi:putative transposase